MCSLLGLLSAAALCAAAAASKTRTDTTPTGNSTAATATETAVASVTLPTVSIEQAEVQLKQGLIFATGEPTDEGRFYYSFKGIPYAKPPLEELRFMPPVPAEGWTELRDGSWNAPECPQIQIQNKLEGNENISGEEDCLYLNVFTTRPYKSDMPVIVYIHGGGFVKGSMLNYKPLPLVTKDIVLVVIQFRLGLLGFLSMEDSVLPGNMGMKDQTLALQWVRDNIQDLGGDPNRVTIMGESSGGASVHFHVLSPHSRGLFHRGIMQSGTIFSTYMKYDEHRSAALKVSEIVNCSSGEVIDTVELLACLRNTSLIDLVTAPSALEVWESLPGPCVPRVDGDTLPEHPASILMKGDYNRVPLIAGYTKDEGIGFASVTAKDEGAMNELRENFTRVGPALLTFISDDGNPVYLAKRIFYHYLGVAEFPQDNLEGVSTMIGDGIIKKGMYDAADVHSRDTIYGDNVYLYELRHRGNNSFTDFFKIEELGNNSVAHGDDLQYLFHDLFFAEPLKSDDDVFVGDIMVSMWINFVRTGNPTPDMSLGFRWTPSTTENRQTLAITTTPYMIKDAFAKEREFWRNLPTKSNKILYPERFQ